MPIAGVVPDWLLTVVAAATVFAVMFDLGLVIVPGEFRSVVERPVLLAKALFAVLVAVPALAWLVANAFGLPRPAEVGIVLMAIAPGAPIALRRSLDAGGHQALAPVLQIAMATLAVVAMPLWIAAFDEYYGGTATIAPMTLARQVFIAQLLPLGLGMLGRGLVPGRAARIEPWLRRIATVLLVVLLALVLANIWQAVVGAGWRVAIAITVTTTLALAVGHLLGGPEPATRTVTAVSSALRNPGLALLVATLNPFPPALVAAVLAYFVVATVTVIPYVAWRKRVASRRAGDG